MSRIIGSGIYLDEQGNQVKDCVGRILEYGDILGKINKLGYSAQRCKIVGVSKTLEASERKVIYNTKDTTFHRLKKVRRLIIDKT